jgi:hypothetical protein
LHIGKEVIFIGTASLWNKVFLEIWVFKYTSSWEIGFGLSLL